MSLTCVVIDFSGVPSPRRSEGGGNPQIFFSLFYVFSLVRVVFACGFFFLRCIFAVQNCLTLVFFFGDFRIFRWLSKLLDELRAVESQYGPRGRQVAKTRSWSS